MNGTSCKNCISAVYEDKTQTGCALERLEILEDNGVTVTPAYDEDKEFFVLDKLCYYHRNEEWFTSHVGDNIQKAIEKENSLVYHAVLWENSEMDIGQAIGSLMIQRYKPQHITLLLRYETIYHIGALKDQLDATGILWKISEKVGIETDDIYHGVKSAMTNHSAPFVFLVLSHKDIYDGLLKNIEQDMIDKGLSFNYVLCPKKSMLIPYKILSYYISVERGNFINQILEDECLTAYSV